MALSYNKNEGRGGVKQAETPQIGGPCKKQACPYASVLGVVMPPSFR